MLSSNVVVVVCLLLFTFYYTHIVYKRAGSSVTLSHLFCIHPICSICEVLLWPVEGMVVNKLSGQRETRALSMEVQERDPGLKVRHESLVRSGARRSALYVWVSVVRYPGP